MLGFMFLKELIVIKPMDQARKCIVCNYYYLFKVNFRFQPREYKIATVSIKENDYRTHFWYLSKDKTINRMNEANSSEKSWIIVRYIKL